MPKSDKSQSVQDEDLRDALAKIADAVKEKQEKPAVPVGRTPSDAAAEITGSLFQLLGQWTTPILLLVLISVGWYFLQEQNQQVDTEYKDALAVLRQERDSAYERISEFNKEMADVSGQQIQNLTEAFDSLKKINTESAERQVEAFLFQQQAKDAKIQAETALVELSEAQGTLTAQQVALESSRQELNRTRLELQERAKELEGKEQDLGQRGGKIGELQDTMRTYQTSSEAYIKKLDEQVYELRFGGADPVTVEQLASELSDLKVMFESATQRVLDTVANPVELLGPIAEFEGLNLVSDTFEPLIGLSAARFVEHVQDSEGFGFDFWRLYSAGGDEAFVGAVASEAGRLRLVIFETRVGDDGTDRIVRAETVEMLLPVIAPDTSNGWALALYQTELGESDIDVDRQAYSGAAGVESLPLVELFSRTNDRIDALGYAFGENDNIPVMSREQFERLTDGETLPFEIQLALGSTNGLALPFAMISEKSAGVDEWRYELASIDNTELRRKVRDILEAARSGIFRDGHTAIIEGVERNDLQYLAALLLMPRLEMRVEFTNTEELADAQRSDLGPLETNENLAEKAAARRTADVFLTTGSGDEAVIRFEADAVGRGWRFVTLTD
ncbi:MAG: hypothetical protein AAGA08_13630 [Pseudomonadota bacterium]